MRAIAFVLAYLACLGHGRRSKMMSEQIQGGSHEEHKDSQSTANTTPSSASLAELEQSQSNAQTASSKPLKVIALLLAALANPAIAFPVQSIGIRGRSNHKFAVSNPSGIRSASNSRLRQRMQNDSNPSDVRAASNSALRRLMQDDDIGLLEKPTRRMPLVIEGFSNQTIEPVAERFPIAPPHPKVERRSMNQRRLIQIISEVGDDLPVDLQGADLDFARQGLSQGPHRTLLAALDKLPLSENSQASIFVDFQRDDAGHQDRRVRNIYVRTRDGSVMGPLSWRNFFAPNRSPLSNRRNHVRKAILASKQWRSHRNFTTITPAKVTDLVMAHFHMNNLEAGEPTEFKVSTAPFPTDVFVNGDVYNFIEQVLREHYP